MALWSNRILIVLGALGIFITGVLSYATHFGLDVPCGGTAGCSIVQQTPFAQIGGVSVSYVGLLGYLGLFAVAIVRSIVTGKTHRRLALAGFFMAALGTVFSLYLTFISLAVIRQKCIWCLASLVVILLTTIVHAALLQGDVPESHDKPKGLLTGGAVMLLALGAVGFTIRDLQKQIDLTAMFVRADAVSLEEMLPIPAKTLGDENAQVTIMEFADVNCHVCRDEYPRIKRIVASYGGSVRLGFRNFPLVGKPGHETSTAAAAIGEYAADKGLFWKYMDEVMLEANTQRITTLQGLIAVASEAGLDREEIVAVFQSGEAQYEERVNDYWARVDADFNLGRQLLIESTPTFILHAEGHKPKPIASFRLEDELKTEPYRSLAKKR